MATGSGSSGGRGRSRSGGSGSSKGAGGSGSGAGSGSSQRSGSGGSSSGQRVSNSRMWSQPATARQIAALKANGNFDGNYYSKGRAGQTIGESVRSTAGASGSAFSTPQQRSSPSAALGLNELARIAEVIGNMLPEPARPESASPRVVVADVVEEAEIGRESRRPRGNYADPGGVLSLEFIEALESRHLDDYRAEHIYGSGDGLRQETGKWAKVKLQVAKRIAEGHAELVSVLREAPAGVAPVPEAGATALLTHAVSADLEERHLWNFLNEHVYGSASALRKEILSWLENRIAIASTNAQGLIELAHAQNAMRPKSPEPEVSPPAPLESAIPARPSLASKPLGGHEGGHVLSGNVTSINAYGAHIALAGGVRGWLHVSKLRVLNGGARVENVADHIRVGQQVRVRDIGRSQRGQILLELASPATSEASRALATDGPDSTSEAVRPVKRRRFFRRRMPPAEGNRSVKALSCTGVSLPVGFMLYAEAAWASATARPVLAQSAVASGSPRFRYVSATSCC